MKTFKNPVIPGFYPDPSVCRVGGDYYLVTSSFEYFPGVPIFHSKDLVNWHQLGHVLTRESQLPLARRHRPGFSQGIFAPTLRYHNGRFYMITTNMSISKNFFVWAEWPEGPWSDPVYIEGWEGIDPSLFFDDDGKVYITGTQGFQGEPEGIYQAEIDLETGKLLSERRWIWGGTGGSYPEGPHLYKINGWYYLMIAEGGTEYGHMVTIARSRTPYGPYESNPNNPILSNRSTSKPIQATGHADLVQAEDGSWWAVFLGIRPIPFTKRHNLGRETCLAPVWWTEEGWPVIGNNGKAELEHDAGNLPVGEPAAWNPRDDFDGQELSPVWVFYRNPTPGSWSLAERPGWLTLRGQAATLNDTGSPAFVGRRQQHRNCEIMVLMEFEPYEEGEEAGLVVFMNELFHYEIVKTFEGGTSKLVLRRRVGSMRQTDAEIEYKDPAVILGVKADDYSYTFFYARPGGEPVELGEGETAFLTSEVANGFTGVVMAMYATGNGKTCRSPAHFDYFHYRQLEERTVDAISLKESL
ncbi:beta-xylosidase [Thermobacillus composti KWC4]|uniref:Beta-xylosidase n=1 Tax=Thermobacillus composti (strain DSM 18247 / JCM 13945 / KWC4) TaxID=717605 RepID=L0EH49_THECK|nr:glycoside hydrolase family 43 protein [Thermobacillus composti]AGA59016.1 beta-xylosidase [Thermobacillus composti KWC4]